MNYNNYASYYFVVQMTVEREYERIEQNEKSKIQKIISAGL